MKKADKAFYFGKDETPDIKACLIHPFLPSRETYVTDGREGFEGVHYGLCSGCIRELFENHRFQRDIDQEIVVRLNDLKKEMNNASD
jgi:hypothetical protein